MKKLVLTCLFFALFTSISMAQLTLEKLGSSRKISFPIGSLIKVKLPTKSSRPECTCFHAYKGYLKKTEDSTVWLALTEENRQTIDENKSGIKETKTFKQPLDAVTTRIPLSKVLAITRYSESAIGLRNIGITFCTLAALSNLLLAPHLSKSASKTFRNGGYVVMGVGLAVAFLPTKRTYYFQQPKNKKKTLWKLGN